MEFETFDDVIPKPVFWVSTIAGSLVGVYLGFLEGGIGGAIVTAAVGAMIGFILPALFMNAIMWVITVMVILLPLAVGVFVIWFIYSLWGVGRP